MGRSYIILMDGRYSYTQWSFLLAPLFSLLFNTWVKNPRPSKKSKLGVNVSLTLKKQTRFQGQRIHFQLRYMVKKSKLIKRKEIRVVTQPICEKRARLAITFHASRRNVDLCISRAKDDDWCTSITHFLDEECF